MKFDPAIPGYVTYIVVSMIAVIQVLVIWKCKPRNDINVAIIHIYAMLALILYIIVDISLTVFK